MSTREKIRAVVVLLALGAFFFVVWWFTPRRFGPDAYRAIVESKYASELDSSETGDWLTYELVLREGEGNQIRVAVPHWVFNRVRPGDAIERGEDGRFSFPPSLSPRELE